MTTEEKTPVTILGPNLRDQSKGSFHVHRAGCADLHKRQYLGVEGDWHTTVTCARSLKRSTRIKWTNHQKLRTASTEPTSTYSRAWD